MDEDALLRSLVLPFLFVLGLSKEKPAHDARVLILVLDQPRRRASARRSRSGSFFIVSLF